MKTQTNLIVFSKDNNLLVLLQGYCFAKNIQITTTDFTMAAIREAVKIQPSLIIVPVSLLCSANNALEIRTLRREASYHKYLTVCALINNTSDCVPPALSAWIDVVIHAPIDLSEFDDYLNSAFPCVDDHVVERRYQERRSWPDRRSFRGNNYNQGSPETKSKKNNIDLKKEQYLGFYIDRRTKQLTLYGSKVDLTPKEFELIELLLSDVDRIFMTEEIIKHLWPSNHRATKSDLYQYMHLLRKKIEEDPNHPKWLMNVKGYGYKLNLSKIA